MSPIDVPAWAWALLGVLLLIFITIDLIAHRGEHGESRKSAIIWSVIWVSAALAFNVFVWWQWGSNAAEQFLAAYLLEKSLSVDTLFVFVVIFASLGIPRSEQRRVLTWGIIGALGTRLIFILVGAAAIQRWHELTYVFGALLVITAIKLLKSEEHATGEPPKLLLWLERHLPWTRQLHGHRFILYSSNVFAVLGLRALYIVLANAILGLRYLRFGLSAVLAFAGVKMLVASWFKIPPIISVGVIATTIGIAIAASVIATRRERRSDKLAPPPSSSTAQST
jgi:tellurite resistance protein TerC